MADYFLKIVPLCLAGYICERWEYKKLSGQNRLSSSIILRQGLFSVAAVFSALISAKLIVWFYRGYEPGFSVILLDAISFSVIYSSCFVGAFSMAGLWLLKKQLK